MWFVFTTVTRIPDAPVTAMAPETATAGSADGGDRLPEPGSGRSSVIASASRPSSVSSGASGPESGALLSAAQLFGSGGGHGCNGGRRSTVNHERSEGLTWDIFSHQELRMRSAER